MTRRQRTPTNITVAAYINLQYNRLHIFHTVLLTMTLSFPLESKLVKSAVASWKTSAVYLQDILLLQDTC